MSLRIGTSGWNYPSGEGTWNGLFYPATRSKRAGTDQFDELRFYARALRHGRSEFDVLRPAAGRGHARLGRADPAAFDFSLKLYQKFTHPKMFKEAALKRAPGTEGPLLDLLAQVTAERHRRVPRRHRPAGIGRQARRTARAVSGELQGHARQRGTTWRSCCVPFATTRSPSSCATGAGATRSATRWRC